MTRTNRRYVVNFPRHLADCEFNYRRLRRLMPGWSSPHTRQADAPAEPEKWCYWVGNQRPSEMAMLLSVQESAPYTTTVHIAVYSRLKNQVAWTKHSHKQPASSVGVRLSLAELPPTLKLYSLDVRLYHDATVAEVIAWQGHRRFQARNEYPNRHMYQRDEKAQLNGFLGELLAACLKEGRVMHNVMSSIAIDA